MPLPAEILPTPEAARTYVNDNIVPNGMNLINGTEANNVFNALITFIEQSPLNWDLATVWSTGGSVVAPSDNVPGPIIIFSNITPTSFSFGNNQWNEYYIVNTTVSPIPLLSGFLYYDVTLTPHTSIAGQSSVNIALAENGQWVQIGGISSGSGTIETSFAVPDIAELRLTPGTVDVNMSVLGYYAPGDEGGGDFYWNATSTAADNGGNVIQVTGVATGRWIRQITGDYVSVRWFGAKGDGVTDDTASVNALISAFTIGSPPVGTSVLFPSGTFVLNNINVPSGFKIYSDQYAVDNYIANVSSKIIPLPGSTNYVFSCIAGSMNWSFQNLYINCNHIVNPNLQGALYLTGTFSSVIGCNIIDAPTSAIVSGAGAVRIMNNNIQGMVVPIFPNSEPTTIIGALHMPAIGDSYIEDNEIGAGSSYDVLKDSQRRSVAMFSGEFVNLVCTGNIFENGDQCVYIVGGEYLYLAGNRYEMNAAGGLNLAPAASGGTIFSTTLVGERFTNNSCSENGGYYDLTIGACQGIQIYSPTFVQQPSEFIPGSTNTVKYNIINNGSINNVLHEPSWFANYCLNGVPIDPSGNPMKFIRGGYNLDDPIYNTVTVQGITTTNPWAPVSQPTGALKLIPGLIAGEGGYSGAMEFLEVNGTIFATIGFSISPNLLFELATRGIWLFINGDIDVSAPGATAVNVISNDGTGNPSINLVSDGSPMEEASLTLISSNGNLNIAATGSVVLVGGNWTFLPNGQSLIPALPTQSAGTYDILTRNIGTGAFEYVPSSEVIISKPLKGLAGHGDADDPVVSLTTYQNDSLIGLGGENEWLVININGAPMFSWGINASFTFVASTGTISGLNPWVTQDALYIDLNQ